MRNRISATEARVHFGELLRAVSSGKGPVIVERSGRPEAVVLSISDYESLVRLQEQGLDALEQASRLRDRILERRGGQPVPPPEDLLREGLEERMNGVLGLP